MSVSFKAITRDGLVRQVAETFVYPGGELHLKNLSAECDNSTIWIADVRFESLNDLGYAGLLADVAHQRQAPFVLFVPYLPAARSDRGEPTGAAVYANLVKSMNPQQVIGIDAHSDIVVRHLQRGNRRDERVTALSCVPLVERVLKDAGHARRYDAVIAPDKGAVERAALVADALGADVYHADKKREFETGKILGIEMSEQLPASGNYLVVDDICDAGGTFKGLATATGVDKRQLGLWITHGIFSGAAPELRNFYDNIYTTDSVPGHSNIGVKATVVPVESYMLQNIKKEF